MAIADLSLRTLNQRVAIGQLTLEEVACESLELVSGDSDCFNVWAAIDADTILDQAGELDRKISRREEAFPLAGELVGVKDVFCTSDYPTSMDSSSWKNRGQFDARVVAHAKMNGAVIFGKTKTAEFAVHDPPDTINSRYVDRAVGTSSSGSAVAVARNYVPIALGSQTAGSISRPASFVGVLGYKPTFGILPRTGVLKTCDDFDTVGLLARKADDCAYFLQHTQPLRRNHPLAARGFSTAADYLEEFALVPFLGDTSVPQAFEKQIQDVREALMNLGLREVRTAVDFDLARKVRDAHHIIYSWNLWYYLREELISAEVASASLWRLVQEGQGIDPGTLDGARRVIERWRRHLGSIVTRSQVLVEPATAVGAPPRGELNVPDDNNLLWTAGGVPTVSIPALYDQEGRNVNAQFVGARYSDFALLQLVESLQGSASVG